MDSLTDPAGAWAPWYEEATEAMPYGGDDVTYRLAAHWLAGLAVEDWGCGYGWFRRYHDGPYLGVDGTASKWCDVVADLTKYRSITPGLLLRHVLEHNRNWQAVLDNAAASATQRLCVVLFTPPQAMTEVLHENVGGLGVPDIAFRLADIVSRLDGWACSTVTQETLGGYGVETLIYGQRS